MDRRIVVWVGLLAIVLVTACGDDDATTATQSPATNRAATTTTEAVQALEPGPITSFEDIAGTYLRNGPSTPVHFLFFEDGTIHISPLADLIVDRPFLVFQARFAGTKLFITTSSCPQPDQGGTYEIHVLENGNLQFLTVDADTCALRSAILQSLRDGVVTAEYVPVP